MELIKQSPYHHKFVELRATFVDRLGIPAPLSFTSVEEKHRAVGPERRIVLIEFDTLDFVPPIGASILAGGVEGGKVTSTDRGYSVGKALALGYFASEHAKERQDMMVAEPDVSHPGNIRLRAIYDPDGVRVRT